MPEQDRTLIITCEHATNHIPDEYAHHFDDPELLLGHRAFDPGTRDLARLIANHFQAPCVEADISRLLVDCNRSQGHRNLFRPSTTSSERQALIKHHYLPFRQAALGAISAAITSSQPVLHLSIHSFTPSLNGERRHADIGFLYDPRRSLEKSFCRRWLTSIKKTTPSLRLRRNYPYRGIADGFATALRKMYGQDEYLGVELEINQQLVTENRHHWQVLQETIIAGLAAALAAGQEV